MDDGIETAKPVVEFWYDFASTYSYLSASRIDPLATAMGVQIRWCPFVLGPIFAAQGLNTSPFAIYPTKGQYMWRDVGRRAARYNIPFEIPADLVDMKQPRSSVAAARLALLGMDEGWGIDFTHSVFAAEFVKGEDIGDIYVLARVLESLGQSPEQTWTRATMGEQKSKLRAVTSQAQTRGVFGAPTFFSSEEMFWGDDRLEDALEWATERSADLSPSPFAKSERKAMT